MFRWVLVSALLAGVDNLQICMAIGVLALTPRQRRLYATAFSAAEMIAALVGVLLGQALLRRFAPAIDPFGAWIALFCGLGILTLAVRNRNAADWFGRPGMLVLLPLGFSIDNLLAGFVLGTAHVSAWTVAVTIGAVGALMSWAGLYAGEWLRRLSGHHFVPRRLELGAGLYLLLLSARMMMQP